MKNEILYLSRQVDKHPLSKGFERLLDQYVSDGTFVNNTQMTTIKDDLIEKLSLYREHAGISTVVIGMSGGADSSLTAIMFKNAGWRVIGYTLPIDQNPEETIRGKMACSVIGIEHREVDLSELYHISTRHIGNEYIVSDDPYKDKIRNGNIRARLRMITLYNAAHAENGLVASTDNASEFYGAGAFFTLHGDVGDIGPIQALNKSWEVPLLSKMLGLPEELYRAIPTDGLGISNGDEEQFGCSYLELDIATMLLVKDKGAFPDFFDSDDIKLCEKVWERTGRGWFKRINPINFDNIVNPVLSKYSEIDKIKFIPEGIKL